MIVWKIVGIKVWNFSLHRIEYNFYLWYISSFLLRNGYIRWIIYICSIILSISIIILLLITENLFSTITSFHSWARLISGHFKMTLNQLSTWRSSNFTEFHLVRKSTIVLVHVFSKLILFREKTFYIHKWLNTCFDTFKRILINFYFSQILKLKIWKCRWFFRWFI